MTPHRALIRVGDVMKTKVDIVDGRATVAEALRAVEAAKAYVTRALRDSLSIGGGVGPLGHLVDLYRRAGEETE